jgi:NADPH:quinone reductase-like Zn-dependent oxidoreductase
VRAIVPTRYGPPDVLLLKEVPKPIPRDNELLIRVHASTVNRTDCAISRAHPFFMRLFTGPLRPKRPIGGTEFAGEVEAAGPAVKDITVE